VPGNLGGDLRLAQLLEVATGAQAGDLGPRHHRTPRARPARGADGGAFGGTGSFTRGGSARAGGSDGAGEGGGGGGGHDNERWWRGVALCASVHAEKPSNKTGGGWCLRWRRRDWGDTFFGERHKRKKILLQKLLSHKAKQQSRTLYVAAGKSVPKTALCAAAISSRSGGPIEER
jgi:hypothetical protein